MAFGKKKAERPQFQQSDVSMLATKALMERNAKAVRLAVRVTGTTDMLMNRWSQKGLIMMLSKMVGKGLPRGNKDLTNDYEASYYRNQKGALCIPCRVIKASIVDGAMITDGVVTKADLKRSLRVLGFTSPIKLAGGPMRMDVRVAMNQQTPDVRARAIVPAGYTFDVVLQFSMLLSPDKVMAAFDGAGAMIGIGDWRPDKGGDFGTFKVTPLPDVEIERILKACDVPEEEYVIPHEYLRAFGGSDRSDSMRKAQAVVEKVITDAAKKRGKAA